MFEKVAAEADAEMFNEDAVRAELTDLYFKLEAGAVSEEEFARREAELVLRLEEIERRGRQRGRHGRS